MFVIEPALLMEGSLATILWHLARNLLGIFVGTAGIVGFGFTPLSIPMRIAFGILAPTILIPPNAFPGADMLDWVGLACAAALLGFNFMRSRASRATIAPQTAP
jgi:TRAP-type uncharacterized transport system fused permease subunit